MIAKETIHVRKVASLADSKSMSALAEKLARHHDEDLRPDPQKLLADKDWFSASLASIDGKDVGFIGWHRLYACQSATRSFELQNLYVEPEYRGQLVAVRLVLEVVRDAFAQDASIVLGVRRGNLAALEFYKKLGCAVIDRNDLWRCRWSDEKMREFASWAEGRFA